MSNTLPFNSKIPFKKRRFNSDYILPLFLLAMFVLQIFLLLLVFFNGIETSKIARKPAPVLVQLIDGQAVKVAPQEALNREPKTIDRIVREWATFTLNWTGKYPNGDPDPGISIGSTKKVPTSAWIASFVLSEDFRKGFLTYLGENFVKPGVLEGQTQSVLQIDHVTFPKQMEEKGKVIPGYWQVDLVSDLILLDLQQPIGYPLKFNKRIYLKAVPPPLHPLEDKSSDYQKAAYQLRQAGLEIIKIEDLKTEDLKNA